jgi:hypothetical protein
MAFALLLLLLALPCVLAWGPGNHLEFEHRVFRQRERLRPTVRRLISEHREAWQYGHIAADIINLKAAGGPYSHCHRWGIVGEMRALASSDFERAFICGYVAHLAAERPAAPAAIALRHHIGMPSKADMRPTRPDPREQVLDLAVAQLRHREAQRLQRLRQHPLRPGIGRGHGSAADQRLRQPERIGRLVAAHGWFSSAAAR